MPVRRIHVCLVTFTATAVVTAIAAMALASPALSFTGGGRQPSEAPLIAVGQHYTGQLTNRQDDANFGGDYQVAIWRLPPLSTRDVIYIDWHSVPSTDSPGYFPVCMTFAQGIDDFTWGTRFDGTVGFGCEASRGPVYTLAGSGTARTEIVAQEASESSYIEFFTEATETAPAEFESFPYDFSLEPPLHYLGVAIREQRRVAANGVIAATATRADGTPAPDGLSFNLAVTWDGGGSASYTGVSSGGVVSFRLALPETAYDKRAIFVVTHPADGTYIGASSRLGINVKKPIPPPPTPCSRARRRVASLAREVGRLQRRARHATGPARRALRPRVSRARARLRAARRHARAVCGDRRIGVDD
jgi:hypothetical protein